MISEQARDSIRLIFERAAALRLRLDPEDSFSIAPCETHTPQVNPRERVVVLTIASILFKIMLILHVDENDASRAYFVRGGNEMPLQDVFLETANMFSGAMNQELVHYFPDLGMSTPYTLSARCIGHLETLAPQFLSHYTILINDTVKVSASMVMSAYAPIDFIADAAPVEESCGELEMF